MPTTPEQLLANAACLNCIPYGAQGAVWISILADIVEEITGMPQTPEQLMANAACLSSCLRGMESPVIISLLAQIAGVPSTPEALIANASCLLSCIPQGMQGAVIISLLDSINENGSALCPQDMQVAWTPDNLKLGELIGFTTVDAASTNVVLTGITTITFQGASAKTGFQIQGQTDVLTSLDFPNLTTIAPGGTLFIVNNSDLTSVLVPVLASVGTGLVITGNALLPSLSFPALTTSGSFSISGTILSSLSTPLLATTTSVSITGHALATINLPALTTATFGFTISGSVLTSLLIPSLTSVASGTFSVTNCPLLTSITAPVLTSVSGLTLATGNTALQTVSFPALVTFNGALSITSRLNLTSINFPLLVSAPTAITLTGNTALTTLSLPALVTGGTGASGFSTNGCTLLTSVSLPNYLPSNTRPQNFGSCALDQASVDHILARCVANAAYVSGTVTLNGGTNATPSAAGLADKATLVGRGVTVLNN